MPAASATERFRELLVVPLRKGGTAHANCQFRAMAQDQLEVMGHPQDRTGEMIYD